MTESFFVVERHLPATSSGTVTERLGFILRTHNVVIKQLYPAAVSFADILKGLGQLKDVEYAMKLKPDSVRIAVPA